MAVKFSPIFNSQVVDENGDPGVGWKVNTYLAGSSTPATTYTTSAGDVAQTNPIVINALGFPTTGQIWLTEGVSYKLVLTNAADVVKKTEDNIEGVTASAATASEWVSGPTPTFVSATSFTLVGDQTSTFHVGRRIKTTNSGGTIYSTITVSAFTTLTTITVGNDSGVLDSGLSAVSYSFISAVNSSQPAPFVCDVRTYTASDTWVKLTGAKTVEVICISAGGSGGGGRGSTAGSARSGGGGGGGGCIARAFFNAADLTSSVSVTVAGTTTGGAGGSSGDGGNGSIGGNSSFGSYLIAYGGGHGLGGTNTSVVYGGGGGGTGGTGGIGNNYIGGFPNTATGTAASNSGGAGANGGLAAAGGRSEYGGAGGGNGASAGSAASAGGSAIYGAGAGAGGGEVSAGNVESAGAAGGVSGSFTAGGGGAAGAANGGAGGVGPTGSAIVLGGGGGGGGGQDSGTGGVGGAGGVPGGGGGGGGAGTTTGGAGGTGGRGEVRVYTYF